MFLDGRIQYYEKAKHLIDVLVADKIGYTVHLEEYMKIALK